MTKQSVSNSSAVPEAIATGNSPAKIVKSETADARPTFRHPRVILPVPTPQEKFQHAQPGVPDTQLTREATGLLHEFSTQLLFNHSHRVFFWANELGRQTGQHYDQELLFVCAAFHDMGLLKKFSSAEDRFESNCSTTGLASMSLASAMKLSPRICGRQLSPSILA